MASRYWLKLYHEILHDPKMGTLSDRLWRRCIEMFLLAGDYDEEGHLPSIEDIAWALRTNADELAQELAELARIGILSKDGNGWYVTKWTERQAAVSGAERMRQLRGRKQREQYYGDDDVTDCDATVTSRHVDTDVDIDIEQIQTTTDKERAFTPVAVADSLQTLLDIGMDPETARTLADEHPEANVLGWCAESRKRKLENPPGWVRSMLVRGHAPPAAYDNGLAGQAYADPADAR